LYVRLNFKALAAAAAVCSFIAQSALAASATVTYSLSLNDNGFGIYSPDEFAVYASDSTADGNAGIASFDAVFTGYNTIENTSPFAIYLVTAMTPGYPTSWFYVGFTYQGADGNPTFYGVDNADERLPYFGQEAGDVTQIVFPGIDAATLVSSSTDTAYSAPLLIGTGTYSGAGPSWVNSSNNMAQVYVTEGSSQTEELDVGSGLVLNSQALSPLPEPTSIGIPILGGFCVLYRRRARN
jgi:hypothetical protein